MMVNLDMDGYAKILIHRKASKTQRTTNM